MMANGLFQTVDLSLEDVLGKAVADKVRAMERDKGDRYLTPEIPPGAVAVGIELDSDETVGIGGKTPGSTFNCCPVGACFVSVFGNGDLRSPFVAASWPSGFQVGAYSVFGVSADTSGEDEPPSPASVPFWPSASMIREPSRYGIPALFDTPTKAEVAVAVIGAFDRRDRGTKASVDWMSVKVTVLKTGGE